MQTRRAKKGRTRYTPEQAREHELKAIDDFNERFPVGADVEYWKSLPMGPAVQTKVRHPCWIIGGNDRQPGEPVCKVEGVAGGVSIYHIKGVGF